MSIVIAAEACPSTACTTFAPPAFVAARCVDASRGGPHSRIVTRVSRALSAPCKLPDGAQGLSQEGSTALGPEGLPPPRTHGATRLRTTKRPCRRVQTSESVPVRTALTTGTANAVFAKLAVATAQTARQ
jgi:hypothetical protein